MSDQVQKKRLPPFEWTYEHDDLLLREFLVVETFKYKAGSSKRGNAWTQIADILNSIESPVFRVNQRAVRDRYNLLQRAFKKKMLEEERASGIDPPKLSDNELAIQEIIEKFEDPSVIEDSASQQVNDEKRKAEEMRKRSMESFSETLNRSLDEDGSRPKRTRGNGSETMSFLMKKAENDAEFRKEELRLKSVEMDQQKQERQIQFSLMQQQQESMTSLMQQMNDQHRVAQQQQQQMMLAFMQSQQQQTQLFSAMLDKLSE